MCGRSGRYAAEVCDVDLVVARLDLLPSVSAACATGQGLRVPRVPLLLLPLLLFLLLLVLLLLLLIVAIRLFLSTSAFARGVFR